MNPLKRSILLVVLVATFSYAGYQFYTAWRLQDPEYQRLRTIDRTGALAPGLWAPAADERRLVNLDRFVETTRPRHEGTREILAPAGVRFRAEIKRSPEKIQTRYLYEALSVMQIQPLPAVNHRMFVESDGGAILPVYVHDAAVPMLSERPLETPIELAGFHVYTYAKGPAIVVDGWVPSDRSVW
ncbi:MAG: hypothetical protein AAGC57_13795 [Pseudomonadota bacterium]